MSFCHLHVHSTFSFLDGMGLPWQIAERVQELGHSACAISDHGNTLAHPSFGKEMGKRGLKSIYGCEFYLVEDLNDGPTRHQKLLGIDTLPHITVLAQNQVGYEHLLALTRISWNNFYYKPRIDIRSLMRYQDGLVVLSGCPMGFPTQLIQHKGEEEAFGFLNQMAAGIEQFYVEIDPSPDFDLSINTTPALIRIAKEVRIPMVLTADAHFPRPQDHLAQDILLAVGTGQQVNAKDRKMKLPWYQYCCDAQELLIRAVMTAPEVEASVWSEAIANTGKIAARCEVELPRASAPVFPGLQLQELAADRLWSDAVCGLYERMRCQDPIQFKMFYYEWLSERVGAGSSCLPPTKMAIDESDIKEESTAPTGLSTRCLLDPFPKGWNSTTSVETSGAAIQSVLSQCHTLKMSGGERLARSTQPKNCALMDIRCQEPTSSCEMMEGGIAEPASVATGESIGGALMGGCEITIEMIPTYLDRALHELSVLSKKDFCSYMLIVADVIRHMKKRDSLVVTRGSAGGCLLLWLVGGSVTDPIRHELSFDRFYDSSRSEPPDIDMDFEQGRREEAIEYMRAKYGEANVAHIAALSQLRAKSAINDVAAAYGISKSEVAPLTNALSSGDDDVEKQLHEIKDPKALAVLTKYPVLHMAEKLIGQYRQGSIHAAGILVSSTPIDKAVGIILGKDKQVVAAVDKRSAADLGFLKMDFLSVNALDVVAGATRLLEKPMSWLETLPLDDPAALALANEGSLAGVFQLDGASATKVLKEIGCENFYDLAAASALCRPGPGDWVPMYARHRKDPERFSGYLEGIDRRAADIVRETLGLLIYQEQVMRLAHELAGLPMDEVQKLRKGVSDKLGTQPDRAAATAWNDKWSAAFIEGSIDNGVSEEEATKWWEAIKSHGGYSFNRSHCVTYALVGYWMLYLKAHHPAALYESYLSLEKEGLTLKKLIREYVSRGGTIQLLSPETSQMRFSSLGSDTLTGGFVNLKGVGLKTAEKLQSLSPFPDWEALLQALPKQVREHLTSTGVPTGEVTDVQALISLASWLPVENLGPEEAAIRDRHNLKRLGTLPPTPVSGDQCLMGYVTARELSKDRIAFILEDETGMVTVRLPSRMVAKEGGAFRTLKVGDFIGVRGWWDGSFFYVKNCEVLYGIGKE